MSDPLGEKGLEDSLLAEVLQAATEHLRGLEGAPAAPSGIDQAAAAFGAGGLPEEGTGAALAIQELVKHGLPAATRSAGPRFFHFVTGGATPAALAADWLTAALDQNSFSWVSSPLGSRIEAVALAWLKELFGLPADWGAVLTTGATMANLTALAAARRWWGLQHGRDIDQRGWSGLPTVPIFSSGYIHVSALKALTMLGLGGDTVRRLPADNSGRLDLAALEQGLRGLAGRPAILMATAGEVNAGDFDPLLELADLARRYNAWLHVDGAFGLFARVSPTSRPLAAGAELAHSVIADGHKWLNVPYTAASRSSATPNCCTGHSR